MYFVIFRDSDGWQWEWRTANNKSICESGGEAYPRRKDWENAIDIVKQSRRAPIELGER